MNKEIENKLVPRLRFPEFNDDWNFISLKEITVQITEKVGKKKLETVSITAGKGFVTQKEKFSRDISGHQYKNYILLQKGDYSYNKGASKKFPQGCIYKLTEFEEVAVPNAFISFKFIPNVIGEFFNGYFDNNFHGLQLKRFITSGARMDGLLNISNIDFFSIIFPTPKQKLEQQKIADCLSSLDDLIRLETEKLDTLKDHKKGLMQQLFPAEREKVPKLRFPEFKDSGDWEERTLGEIGKFIGGGTPDTLNPEYWNGHIQWFTPTEIKSGRLTRSSRAITNKGLVNSSAKILPIGTILITTRATVGDIAIADRECTTNQGFQSLFVNQDQINLFWYYWLSKHRYELIRRASGSTFLEIGKSEIARIKALYPKKLEQQKIANCLSSLDEQISIQTQKIEDLKLHKKGLMQGLFPQTNTTNN
ncbi:restriction endonuclease subunit S [Pedobacter glucosidilyticus]|uniref:restriction endonuclease subunit S n=1 Tax=Pedobacter glucosidilyticus TaxID=1122941 RepID=UPI0003FD3EA2|nr:restriction endonuclease subunit S [Pedobacter glucosidilyticus]